MGSREVVLHTNHKSQTMLNVRTEDLFRKSRVPMTPLTALVDNTERLRVHTEDYFQVKLNRIISSIC